MTDHGPRRMRAGIGAARDGADEPTKLRDRPATGSVTTIDTPPGEGAGR